MNNLNTWTRLLRHLSKEKTLVLWGTGQFSNVLTDYLIRHDFEIRAYIDSKQELENGVFLNKPVFHPVSFKSFSSYRSSFVVIASSFHDEISQKCRELGCHEFENYLISFNLAKIKRSTFLMDTSKIEIDLPKGDIHTKSTYRQIVHENEYRLPSNMNDWTVIDIGANVGTFVVAATLRNAGEIVSYEPSQILFPMLRSNCQKLSNSQTKITSINKAVSNRLNKHVYFEESTWGNNSLMGHTSCNPHAGYQIEATNLTEIIEAHSSIDLIKIDCEEAEFEILPDVSFENLKKVSRICGEWHDGDENQPRLWKLLRYFHDAGWKITFNTSVVTCRCGLFWAVNPKTDLKSAFEDAFMFTEKGIEEPTWR